VTRRSTDMLEDLLLGVLGLMLIALGAVVG
jgi:hypothetical protein